MSNKNANNVPLGTFNPTFGGAARSAGSLLRPDYMSGGPSDNGPSHQRSIEYHHESGVKRSRDSGTSGNDCFIILNYVNVNLIFIKVLYRDRVLISLLQMWRKNQERNVERNGKVVGRLRRRKS